MLRAEQGPEQILQLLFEGIPLGTSEMTPLEFRCTCSRPQVQSMLKALGPEELEELANKEEPTTVTCEFCKESYSFTGKQLNLLLEALKSTDKGPQ